MYLIGYIMLELVREYSEKRFSFERDRCTMVIATFPAEAWREPRRTAFSTRYQRTANTTLDFGACLCELLVAI
jgi:hypothetical protein